MSTSSTTHLEVETRMLQSNHLNPINPFTLFKLKSVLKLRRNCKVTLISKLNISSVCFDRMINVGAKFLPQFCPLIQDAATYAKFSSIRSVSEATS